MAGGDTVSEPWDTDDVEKLTDGDIQAARYATVHLSDPSEYSYKLVETVRQNEALETPSDTIDRGLRVELAYIIDTNEVTFSRVEYDIRYTIPPPGWIFDQDYAEREIIPYGKSGIEWAADDDRSIGTTTTRVCKDMIDQAIEEGVTDTISALIQRGLERMIGQREIPSKNSHNRHMNVGSSTEEVDEYPIVTIFKGDAYHGLTDFSIRQAEKLPTQWYRMEDLAEKIDCSASALFDIQDEMVGYGILEKSDSTGDAKMPRYRIPNSMVVDLLNEFHANYTPNKDPYASVSDISLSELMGSSGRASLIAWFLANSDKNTTYSKNGIVDNSPVSNHTVREYIDDLAQLGIVETKRVSRGSQTYIEYVVNHESPINKFLSRLNEVAVTHRSVKQFDFDELLN